MADSRSRSGPATFSGDCHVETVRCHGQGNGGRGASQLVMLAGYAGDEATVIDADVSTVTGASDKVIRVRGPSVWLLDVNFQRGPDASVPRRATCTAPFWRIATSCPAQRGRAADVRGLSVEHQRPLRPPFCGREAV